MTQDLAIELAVAFMVKHRRKWEAATPIDVVRHAKDEFTDYDCWHVYFETHPGCEPSFTLVEIRESNNKIRFVPIM
jgi:hypothetical protein